MNSRLRRNGHPGKLAFRPGQAGHLTTPSLQARLTIKLFPDTPLPRKRRSYQPVAGLAGLAYSLIHPVARWQPPVNRV
jgi:hypothetical protein